MMNRSLRIILYTLCLLLMSAGAHVGLAQPAPTPHVLWLPMVGNGGDAPTLPSPQSFKAGEWHLIFEVVRGKPKATWVGQVWEYGIGDDAETLLDERTLDITSDCQIFGAPTFSPSSVSFNGVSDTISCTIPDYVQIFTEMDPELAECRCFYTSPPWATANVEVAYFGGRRPVIYHPRLELAVEALDPLAKVVASLKLHFFGGGSSSWSSEQFPVFQADGHQIWGGYNPVRFVEHFAGKRWFNFLTAAQFAKPLTPDLAAGFWLWESEAEGVADPVAMPDSFGLGPGTTVYIGHNPVDNTYFIGDLTMAVIDPGCRSH
jgi:hypothetical protein